jgi:hypothetical protein
MIHSPPFCTLQCATIRHEREGGGISASDRLDECAHPGGPPDHLHAERKGKQECIQKYAGLRNSSRLPYSHSIIYDAISALICKHKSSKPAVKSRRYIRRNFFDLEFTGKFERVGGTAASGSIGVNRLMAARA